MQSLHGISLQPDQLLPSLSQLVGSSGAAEVLLEQPQALITDKRTFKRGRRSEVEYLVSFPAFPGQDAWYPARDLRNDITARGKDLILDYELEHSTENAAPHASFDAPVPASCAHQPFTQQPWPDSAPQRPSSDRPVARTLQPMTQQPFGEPSQGVPTSPPHLAASMPPAFQAPRPSASTSHPYVGSGTSHSAPTPAPQQAARLADYHFRLLARSPNSPIPAQQREEQPGPQAHPPASPGQGNVAAVRIVNGLPASLWGEGPSRQAPPPRATGPTSHTAWAPAPAAGLASDEAAALWGRHHVPNRSPPTLGPSSAAQPPSSPPQHSRLAVPPPFSSPPQHSTHRPPDTVPPGPSSSMHAAPHASHLPVHPPVHAPVPLGGGAGRPADFSSYFGGGAAHPAISDSLHAAEGGRSLNTAAGMSMKDFMTMVYRMASSAPAPGSSHSMQQPQPPVNLQSPPSHAKQRLDGIAEAAAEASEDGASSDSSMDEAGLQRIAEHHHAPRAQPFGQHARSPEPVAPEDLIPDSAEPALQSHPPQDTTMPDAGPVTQTVPAELPDVVPDSAEPDPEPDPAAADEQAAGDRGDRMQDQDMGGGQDVHAGPPSPAKLSEEENVRAWSACRMHFAPGRTRHDRAMRHPQRYTRPLFEAHEAAQAAEHAWYAGPYARPAPLPAASMPLPAGQSLPSASPFAQQAATTGQPLATTISHPARDPSNHAGTPTNPVTLASDAIAPRDTVKHEDLAHDEEDELDTEFAEHMGPKLWCQAAIGGAKQIEGGLLLHITWNDGFTCWADHTELKSRQHCKDELIRFYESKIRKVPRSQKNQQ